MLSTSTTSTTENVRPQVIGGLPDWGTFHATDLLDTLTSSEMPFPCTFAVSAAKRAGLRFGFVENLHDRRTWAVLPAIVLAYLESYQRIARETSLILLFKREQRVAGLTDYHRKFWEVLQFLHDHDPVPWPVEIPRRADDSRWEFSFGGTPMFVVCNTPAHRLRQSRYSPSFTITLQPRWVFEDLGADTVRGSAARRVIRNRLRAFDATQPSPELGNYGDPDNREWRQYFLPEHNEVRPSRCPLRHG
jgi:uncharacterized protein